MKNIFKSLMAFAIIASVSSCSDEQDLKFATPAAEFNILTPQSGDGVVLKPETPTNPALVMTWEAADMGTPTEITYAVQIDKNGDEFANPITLTTTTSNFISVDMQTLNGAAISAGLEPFSEAGLDVRVMATVGSMGSEASYSNVITYLVTPYTTESPKVYVVGNFLANSGYGSNWTPADAVPLAASGFGQTDFEGYVYMNEPSIEYKILPTNESFDGDYGDDGSFTGTLLQTGESNIAMTGPGYYLVKANTQTLTYSATPQTWGIIGAATPNSWDDETVLTYDPATKKWTGVVNLVPGEFKFRANHDWNIVTNNFGAGTGDLLSYGGGNLTFSGTAGSYTVTLDLSHPREYTYTLTPN
ncbi:MAG: SusF/SusE family outer membrane protein [Flavobacterium sp.]|nr:MAG: SusF/SusE family outer membrane protein [Flavobacterium sp.]